MKIQVKKVNVGTEVGVYIPLSELKCNEYQGLTQETSKDYRIKRTFRKMLSKKSREALGIIIKELFSDFNYYNITYEKVGDDYVIELIEKKFQNSFDQYQHKLIKELLEEIAFAVVFKKESNLQIETIRNRYALDSQNDMLVSLVGSFGYGKTTLIKKMLGFEDEFKFLLVDNGRTTIYNTVVRGLLTVQEDGKKYILQTSEGTEKVKKILLEEYKFKNKITLYSCQEVYENTIFQNLAKAFTVFCENKDDVMKCKKEFIKNSKCNLDNFFGEVEESLFYDMMLDEFREQLKGVEDEQYPDFVHSEVLFAKFNDLYEKSIKDAVNLSNGEQMNYNANQAVIDFNLTAEGVSQRIDQYYKCFTDNTVKGGGLRILVKEMYVETDFDVTSFVNNKDEFIIPDALYETVENEKCIKYHSIVFVDTIGCGHEQNSIVATTKGLDGDIVSNIKLLNECDLIIVLENAMQTMQESIKKQLYTLETLGFKNKLIICYSHYNQFVKFSMKDDNEREEELNKYLHESLRAMYDGDSNRAEKVYNRYTSEIGIYETNRQIVYLKGMVQRTTVVEINTNSKTNNRRNQYKAISGTNEESKKENEHANVLNSECKDCNHCLSELIEKMVLLLEENEFAKKMDISIKNLAVEESFAVEYYSVVYPQYLDAYLSEQYRIYSTIVPAWNTSKALCYNAKTNKAEFFGSNMVLRPFVDAMGAISCEIATMLAKSPWIEIQIDDEGEQRDKALDTEFLNDQIKSMVSTKISDFFSETINKSYQKRWDVLYSDSGEGVKYRRSSAIYELLRNEYEMEAIKKKILEIIRSSIKDVVEMYNR